MKFKNYGYDGCSQVKKLSDEVGYGLVNWLHNVFVCVNKRCTCELVKSLA